MRKLILALALAGIFAGCADKDINNEDKPSIKAIETDQSKTKEEIDDDNEENIAEDEDEDYELYGDYQKHQETIYEYFDTVTTFIAYTKTEEEFDKYKNILTEELAKYHKLYNSYDHFDGVNNFLAINQNAGKEPVQVDPKIIDLIKYSKEMYELTEGNIDIAMGSLLGLWHEYREMSINNPDKAAIPREDDLVKASQHKDIDAIVIDEEKSTVYINDKDVQIDIGAIGKGYATKLIGEKLKEAGLEAGILSVGGDDVLIGKNPSSSTGIWKIAIQNPDLEDKENPYIAVAKLGEESVVTSGDYQRFFVVDGKRYHHIIDPATMYPSTRWTSVSVVLDDIALADTISTYLFIVDLEKGKEVAEKYGAKVLWIGTDGKQYRTDSWAEIEEAIE